LSDRWIFSARYIDIDLPRASQRLTLTYRLLATLTAGVEYNPRADELAPLVNWLALPETAVRPALIFGASTDRLGTPSGRAYYATVSKSLRPLLRVPIAPYIGAAYGTYEDRLRAIGGVNMSFTENVSVLVTYNGVHTHSIVSLTHGPQTFSFLYLSGGDLGAAWNVTW
jgi:hypothetical protein